MLDLKAMSTMEVAGIVTLSGIIIVFGMLILLTGLIWLTGTVLKAANSMSGKGRKDKTDKAPAAPAVEARPASGNTAVAAAPESDDGELVSVIAAAYAFLESESPDKSFRIRSIKPVKAERSVWGYAGVVENTRPF